MQLEENVNTGMTPAKVHLLMMVSALVSAVKKNPEIIVTY